MIKTYYYNHADNAFYHDVDLDQKNELLNSPDNLLWIDMYNGTTKELEYIGQVFDFHPLAIEDCLQENPRAKVDHYDGYNFFVFHALRYIEESGDDDEITSIELDVFLGPNYIVTIHPVALAAVGKVADICRSSSQLMDRGPDYLLYSIIDRIVDDYFPIIDRLGERIDDVEDEIFINPTNKITEEMMALRTTIVLMRKALLPQRRIFSNVNGRYSFAIREDNKPYYLDVVDHLDRIIDSIDTYRDLISSSTETYYTIITSRTNEVMQVLTVVATIMMPLTFITGLYGMNVRIPAEDTYNYFWFILGGMGALVIFMLSVFKKRNWI
ncbi:MAG: magnesium/cobalt transporter CorA [Syntrophomonadaceae bacterium]|nr:magnesium/cobalt transporter CorA [Syntrophomonadaceae bacterium]